MGTLMMLAGLGAILYALIIVQGQARKAKSWPTTEGKITRSGVQKQSSATYDSPNTFHEAQVEYTYQVKGRTYHSKTLKSGGTVALSLPGHAESLANQYRPEQRVQVYYNPQKPIEACLDPNEEVSVFYIAMGLFFMGFGLFL